MNSPLSPMASALRRGSRSLFRVPQRFKAKNPRPPRDPPPRHPMVRRRGERTFDPFVTASEFESEPKRGGQWTRIAVAGRDGAASSSSLAGDSPPGALSPDVVGRRSQSPSQPMVVPRTPGGRAIAKWAAQQTEGHQKPPRSQIEIIAQDDHFLFVRKPAGIACHGTEEYEYSKSADIMDVEGRPSRKRKRSKASGSATFYEQFLDFWWSTYPFFRFQPRMLHRLDKEVSGVMVFGKKWCAEEHFTKLLSANPDYFYGCGVKKCYVAVCSGIPHQSEGVIEGTIKRAHWNYRRFAIYPNKGQRFATKAARVDAAGNDDHRFVDNRSAAAQSGGSHVKSEFKVIDSSHHGTIGVCSLIIFTIHSGKRHQIRASAAALGTPIVGDVVYGGSKYNALLLHSLFVGFEGIADTDLIYAVSCLPKWAHLTQHFWSTKAQYLTQQHLDRLMTAPRPSKKPRVIQFSMRRERARLKREALSGKNQFLLPMDRGHELEAVAGGGDADKLLSDGRSAAGDAERAQHDDRGRRRATATAEHSRSGLEKMEHFVSANFIEQTVSSHFKQLEQSRRSKAFERPRGGLKRSEPIAHDPLFDGAVPSHFVDVV